MSVLGIDIGSSTTKIIEYKEGNILSKKILRIPYTKEELKNFIKENNINDIEKYVFTGTGAENIKKEDYDGKVESVDEFVAIAKGGLYLTNLENAIVISVGTGTALIEATSNGIKHLGGSGVGAGTLFNICNRIFGVKTYDEIFELAEKGDIGKIDLRIGDVIEKEIETLPKDLTLSNFGKFEKDAKKEDIILGLINMIFEVIGMMAAFASLNSEIKDMVLIGNIAALPGVKEMLKKIEHTHKVKFFIPEEPEFGVALGAIKTICK